MAATLLIPAVLAGNAMVVGTAAGQSSGSLDAAVSDEAAVSAEERALLESAFAAPTQEAASHATPAAPAPSLLDLSFILDAVFAEFSGGEPRQLGGHDPHGDGFHLQQLELSIGSVVDPYFRFDANLVFSEFGVEVEEAYATTTALPGNLQARAGQFLTRFGRINPTHPHTWHFVDQTLVVGKFFGSEGSRGLGTELSWLSPLPWYLEAIGSATNATGECCARSFLGADDPELDAAEAQLYTLAIKQFFDFGADWSLLWGLSGQFGPNGTGNGNMSDIAGTDLYLRYRPLASANRAAFAVQVEWMQRRRQVPFDLLQDQGGYLQAVWQLTPRWESGLRHEAVTGLADDPLDSDWRSLRTRDAVQLTFYPSHFSRLRFQLAEDRPRWAAESTRALFIALEVVTGAHGAHTY